MSASPGSGRRRPAGRSRRRRGPGRRRGRGLAVAEPRRRRPDDPGDAARERRGGGRAQAQPVDARVRSPRGDSARWGPHAHGAELRDDRLGECGRGRLVGAGDGRPSRGRARGRPSTLGAESRESHRISGHVAGAEPRDRRRARTCPRPDRAVVRPTGRRAPNRPPRPFSAPAHAPVGTLRSRPRASPRPSRSTRRCRALGYCCRRRALIVRTLATGMHQPRSRSAAAARHAPVSPSGWRRAPAATTASATTPAKQGAGRGGVDGASPSAARRPRASPRRRPPCAAHRAGDRRRTRVTSARHAVAWAACADQPDVGAAAGTETMTRRRTREP